MIKFILYKWSLILSTISILAGAMMKILHLNFGGAVLSIGMILSIIYIILGIYNVFTNPKITKSEKIMWQTAFIFFNALTGILYLSRFKKDQSNS